MFECSNRARQLFEQSADRKRLARLDVNLAPAHHRLGRHREALECSERALRVLDEIKDGEGMVAAAINSAVTLTAMHEFERAEERYRAALRMASGLKMASWVLLSRYNLAYLRYLRGDVASALEELQVLRNEYEACKDDWIICQCWLDESEILLEIGDLEESICAARRARDYGSKLGLNAEIAKSFLHEAAAAMRLGRDDEAFQLLHEATCRFAAEGDKVSTAVSQLQNALFRGENGDRAALDDALAARSQLLDSGLPHRMALANIVVGRIQRAIGEVDSAVDSFKSGLDLAAAGRSEWMQVTLLSSSWSDDAPFRYPDNAGNRVRSETNYRLAIASGKGINFPVPADLDITSYADFGTDGVPHNFLRYLESGGSNIWYRGSLVSLYYYRQATGTYKCCSAVYSPPTRQYVFDTDFLVPSQLPPGTPRFRDINNLSFRQTIRADSN
jgi:tetratricopeptide (TPR) repeat protein